jgi:hypothetical protein
MFDRQPPLLRRMPCGPPALGRKASSFFYLGSRSTNQTEPQASVDADFGQCQSTKWPLAINMIELSGKQFTPACSGATV